MFFFDRVGSDTLTEMYNDLVKGEDVYARDIADAQTFISDIRKRTGFEKWDFKKTYSVELESGQTIKLNLQQLMSIYAYSKREQAAEHMRVGGFRFAETETFGKALKRKDNSKTSYRLSIADQAKILGLLTAEQKQYATKMQDYLSTVMGAKGNEASRVLYGVDLFKENFYFPLKSDSDFRFEASQGKRGYKLQRHFLCRRRNHGNKRGGGMKIRCKNTDGRGNISYVEYEVAEPTAEDEEITAEEALDIITGGEGE